MSGHTGGTEEDSEGVAKSPLKRADEVLTDDEVSLHPRISNLES